MIVIVFEMPTDLNYYSKKKQKMTHADCAGMQVVKHYSDNHINNEYSSNHADLLEYAMQNIYPYNKKMNTAVWSPRPHNKKNFQLLKTELTYMSLWSK